MVKLMHENSLLQKIEDLATNRKIQSTVGLTAQDAETKIQKLIPTTRQRINAVRFYLDLIENMNYAPYMGGQSSLSEGQKPLVDFSNRDFQVQINLLNSGPFPLVVFIVLNGFFSNLVSLEDCIAKIINIVYNLTPYNKRYSGFHIRQRLKGKISRGDLTRHLRVFHAVYRKDKSDVEDKKGATFNIAKEIRNQLTHDDITDIVDFPSAINLSGSAVSSDLRLRFRHSFFPDSTDSADTEIIAFCDSVFKETVDFVDECYRLIHGKLQHSGVLPVL
jgi:hypothetical protein